MVEHTAAGLKRLIRRLLAAGVVEVGIERGDGPVVDALLAAELVVLVIAPNQLKNLRSRYGSAGNKDDRYDAYVLADVVRTDRRRLTPLTRSTPATIALRSSVRARTRPGRASRRRRQPAPRAPADRLPRRGGPVRRARLRDQPGVPGAVHHPSPGRLAHLDPARAPGWPSSGYSGRVAPEVLHARLLAAPRGTTGPEADAHAAVVLSFVAVLRTLNTQIDALEDSIADQLEVHPDAHIVTSLPRSGMLRAARLLAEIGDARGRFPTADSLACLAGVAPSTRQSGKVKAVTFRWAADKELRDALCDFAGDSRHANPWAADLYNRARARNHDHPHAVRILGRAWANIIWRCWQDGVAYDPDQHDALQRVLNEHAAKAA